jgi:hypothetical protein
MKNSNVGATHTGAFREWKEDFETVEILLPLPPATAKRELVCVITPDSLHIRHTRLQASLLVAQPLTGPVIAEESTWWLEGSMLNLVLAKQWRGETKSDQYWGAQLAAKGGTYECYMPPAQVRAAKQAELAQERHARIEKADAAAKARAAEAAEAEAEAARQQDAQAAALQAARRRRAAGPPGDDARRSAGLRDGETRKPRPRAQPSLASKRLAPPRAASHPDGRIGIALLLHPPAPEWLLRRLRARLHTCKRGLSRSPAQGATRSASRHRRLRSSHFREQATGGHELEGIRRRVQRRARVAAAEPVEAGRVRHHIWRGHHGGGEPLGRGGPRIAAARMNDN